MHFVFLGRFRLLRTRQNPFLSSPVVLVVAVETLTAARRKNLLTWFETDYWITKLMDLIEFWAKAQEIL